MIIQANPDEFAGKRVLVSGGTKGLGRATVKTLSRRRRSRCHNRAHNPGSH